MSWRLRLLVLAPVFLFIMGALVESCTSSGSGVPVVFQPGPGFNLESISVCEGPAATFTPTPSVTPKGKTPTPTVTPCPGISSTTVAAQSTVSFHAQGFFTKQKKSETLDITNSPGTLWTSSDSSVLEPPLGGNGGEYFAATPGCACANASSGGVTSLPVSVAVATSVCPVCPTPLPTPTPTPKAASTAAAARRDTAAPQSMGVLLWTRDGGGRVSGQIATTSDGNVFFVTRDGVLHAVDSRGRQIFTSPAVGSGASVLGADGTVYVAGSSGDVLALAPDGSARWRSGVRGAPLVAISSAIVVKAPGELIAVGNPGTTDWRLPMTDTVVSGAPMAEGFVVESPTAVTAISANGVIQWSFAVPGGTSSEPATSESAVYAAGRDGRLYAIDAATGAELWHLETRDTAAAGPAVAPSGTIYFASDAVYALSSDGQVLWSGAPPGGRPTALAALASGGVFVVGSDETAAAISPSGTLIWTTRSFGAIDSVAGGPDGAVYLASQSGRIFAVR
jgi:outer membrane protein assembly factor BamB